MPPGLTAFDLPLGPVRVRILDVPTTAAFVEEHYAPFAEPCRDDRAADLVIRCREEARGLVLPLPPPGGSTALEVEPLGDDRFRICSHWQDGSVDLRSSSAEIVLTDRGYIPFRMSLENFLRIAGQLALLPRNAFLMHAAGVVDGARAFLMFGPSGAGKSTATMFSAPRAALSDDMVLVELAGAGARAHAVPFFGAFPPRDRLRGTWPIAAALRLRQADADRVERLSPARAVATVSASIPFVHELGVRHDGLTALVARFCGEVPVADLHFRRGAAFWDEIARAFPG